MRASAVQSALWCIVPRWFHVASYVMAALFVVCAALQYNDPDPIVWMSMYGACAVVTAVLPSKRALVPVAYVLAIGALVWAAVLLYGVWGRMEVTDVVNKMSEKGGAVEEGRELGGLALSGVWLLFAASYARGR